MSDLSFRGKYGELTVRAQAQERGSLNIERGERNVALVNVEKIARAFRISLNELFRGI